MESKRDLAINQVPITTKPEVQSNYGTERTLLWASKRDLVISQVPITTNPLLPKACHGFDITRSN